VPEIGKKARLHDGGLKRTTLFCPCAGGFEALCVRFSCSSAYGSHARSSASACSADRFVSYRFRWATAGKAPKGRTQKPGTLPSPSVSAIDIRRRDDSLSNYIGPKRRLSRNGEKSTCG